MRCLTLGLAVAGLIAHLPLSAQQSPLVAVGDRVRVSQCLGKSTRDGTQHSICERTVGTLAALSHETIAVADGADGFVSALGLVTSIDVSRGRKSNFDVGVLGGALTGVAAGLLLALFEGDDCLFDNCIIALPALLMTPGVVIGGLAGLLTSTERWEEIPLDRLRMSVAPQRDGRLALGVSLRF